ncbi:MAG: hypothetical protein JW874_04805 [Spirochaetales bacterium]|nr:hypothetical protein [Spirochaetales bacterium]
MFRIKITVLSCLFIVVFVPETLLAQDFLSGEFWAPYAVVTPEFDVKPPDVQEMIAQLLDEMCFVFGGMIYGFSFSYVPSDVQRSVAEVFELEPLGEIRKGDRNMEVYQTRIAKPRVYARTRYTLHDFQYTWLEYWNSTTFPSTDGKGEAGFILGVEQKIEACKAAIREAVRGYLRKRIHNKPKKVIGYVRMDEVPYIIINAGKYLARVRVSLDIHEIEEYETY